MQQQLLRQQEALKTAHDQAVEASQMKTLLLAKVNHELRTPLGGILGYAELLHAGIFGPLNQEQKRAAAQIIDSSQYLHALINELLDAAQIESRRLNLRLEQCSPAALLAKVNAAMCVLADKKRIALTTSLDKHLPETIIGDEQRLQQILINLVGNAIKYTEAGEVRVELNRCEPKHWQICVADTGAGISENVLPHIFEPFRQGDDAITVENRGAGLGLSITRQLVNLMGGDIQVESRVGEGSKFTVTLPLDFVLQDEIPC
jgi:signal transduction histidine kinase